VENFEPVDIPDTEGLTPDEASVAIAKVMAAAHNPGHPYSSTAHPQHRAMAEAVAELYRIDAQREVPSAIEQMAANTQEHNHAQQAALQVEVEVEVKKLRELGFEGNAPTNVQPYLLSTLKMQRLHAQGDYENLVPVMEGELRTLKTSDSILRMFQDFARASDLDPDLKSAIFEKLVAWIHTANKTLNTKPTQGENP
jgi:hypothetical protein